MKSFPLVVLILLLGLTAFSKPKKKTPGGKTKSQSAEASESSTPSSETHKFTGLKLKGQLKKPDLSYIYKRKGLRAEQIVNIPEDFNNEIISDAGRF